MRKSLVDSLLQYCENPEFCVLCGDLGFNALEPLKERLGDRFINAGIAEQNMISVAAGLAQSGMKPWVYSISPFIYGRAFEQVRNDICLQDLPVYLIGSGAGFGYGIAGPSHHSIEDCGTMSCLQNMTVFIPSFKSDFDKLTPIIMNSEHPIYLRLGRDESPLNFDPPSYDNYRKLVYGEKGIILALGSISGMLIELCLSLPVKARPNLWSCGKLHVDFNDIPEKLLIEIKTNNYLIILEDHVSVGGLGEQFIKSIVEQNVVPAKFYHRYAKGYISELYGSQDFYRKENGLDNESLANLLKGI